MVEAVVLVDITLRTRMGKMPTGTAVKRTVVSVPVSLSITTFRLPVVPMYKARGEKPAASGTMVVSDGVTRKARSDGLARNALTF